MALTDNLISYWKLDEASGNALDAHGTNELTDTNTVGATTGIINNGRNFAGLDHFTIADNDDLSTGNIDWTFSLWVNQSAESANDDILGKASSPTAAAASSEYLLRCNQTADRFQWFVSNGTSYVTAQADNHGSVAVATWYHIVCWHDATANEIGIAVNDGTPNTAAIANGPTGLAAGFSIGRAGDLNANYWQGIIDEVGFWKRVLTSAERTELYNAGAGLSYDDFAGGAAASPLLLFMQHQGLYVGMNA